MGLKLLDRELFDKKTFGLLTELNQDFYSFKEASQILGERISANMRLFDNTIFKKVERKNKWFLSKGTVLLLSLRNKFESINLKGRSAYNRKYTIDFGTKLKILNRPCEICFKPPKYWEDFLDLLNNEPIILEPIIRSVDCSNIKDAKMPKMQKKEITDYGTDLFLKVDKSYKVKKVKVDDWDFTSSLWTRRKLRVNRERETQESAVKEESKNHKFYVFKNCLYYFNSLDKHTEEDQKLLITILRKRINLKNCKRKSDFLRSWNQQIYNNQERQFLKK